MLLHFFSAKVLSGIQISTIDNCGALRPRGAEIVQVCIGGF